MKKKLKAIFDYYKRKYKLKTTLSFDTIELHSFFDTCKNIIFCNLYISQIEHIEKDSILCTSIGDFKGTFKNKREGYIWILLHEIKHAIDYTCNYRKLIKELEKLPPTYFKNSECYHKQLFEKRADRFAIKELKICINRFKLVV